MQDLVFLAERVCMLGKLLDQFLASEAQTTGVFDYKVAVKPLKGSGFGAQGQRLWSTG